MFRGLLADRSPYRKLLVLVGCALFFVILFTMLGGLFSAFLFGVNPFTNPDIMNLIDEPQVVNALKLMQTFSAIGLFIVPVLLSAFLFDVKPFDWLRINKLPSTITFLLVIITILVSAPLINWMMELNQHLALPSFLKSVEDWMKESESRGADFTILFAEADSFSGLAINLFIMALLPAIGEELLFRGATQRLLIDLTKNKHIGIILSAVVFSAIHVQFYGFLPRMMMGIYFGYLVLWTGSLWPGMVGHFINNASAIIFMFLQKHHQINFDPDTVGTLQGDELMLVISVLAVAFLILLNYRLKGKTPTIQIAE